MVTLLGENRYWSLLEVKGFRQITTFVGISSLRGDRQVGELSVVSFCSELASGELQDLSFKSCRQDIEFSESCWQDLEFSKSCRQDLEFS